MLVCSYLSPFDRIHLSRTCKSLYSLQLYKSAQNDNLILSGLSTSHLVTDRFFAHLIDGMTERHRSHIVHVDLEFASHITVHAVMMALTSFVNLRSLDCRYCRNIKLPDLASALKTSVVHHQFLEKVYLGDWKMPISREWDDAWYTIEEQLGMITGNKRAVVPSSDCSRCHTKVTPLSRVCCQCKKRVWHCQEPPCYSWWSEQMCPTCNVIACYECRTKNAASVSCSCDDMDLERRDECTIFSCKTHGRRETHISARPDLFCVERSTIGWNQNTPPAFTEKGMIMNDSSDGYLSAKDIRKGKLQREVKKQVGKVYGIFFQSWEERSRWNLVIIWV